MRASHGSVRRTAVVVICLLLAATSLPATVVGAGRSSPVVLVGSGRTPVTLPASPSQPSADGTVAVAAPDTSGSWGQVLDWGIMGKHMTALPTGKVLVWSVGDNARVWDPGTGTFSLTPATFGDLHCAGQSTLADGRIIVVGGQNGAPHNGTNISALFDPFSETWTQGPAMSYLRWYATSTTLADGRVLATSGDAPDGTRAVVPEVFDPARNTWTKLTGAVRSQSLYPLMFVLPNGKVFESGPGANTAVLDPTGNGSWTPGPTDFYSTNGYSESAVMLRPGVVLRAGGGDPAQARVTTVDMNVASPAWRDVTPMSFPRRRMNLTILADGTAIAIGGTRAADDANQAVLEAEIWDPSAESWTTVAPMAEARMYHSSAVLLPDGRVVVAGGEASGRLHAQIYSPPYLFKGARPTIAGAPDVAGYGSTFSVTSPDAASISSVALIRSAAATHAFDENQRFVPLTFTRSGSTLSVAAPPSGGYAPPGYYMLVIKNGAGVPSVGRYIRVDSVADLTPGTITGHVTDAGTGLPIAGASVSTLGISTLTDGAGAYNLSNVPTGDRQIAFSATGYADVGRSQTVTAGGTFTVDVALAPPGSVDGVVTDATTANPIAGATVTYPGGSTTTDANGAYSVTGLPAGAQPFSAAATGYDSLAKTGMVIAGGQATLDFALDPAATYITGDVRDASTTQPIPAATVSLTGGGDYVADQFGRYRIDVPPGTYTVTASAPGYFPVSHAVDVTAGAYASMDFSLTLRPASTKVVPVSIDAYAKGSSPTKNYGKDTVLRVRSGGSSSGYTVYLRFDVAGLNGRTISGAQLRMFTTDPSPDGGHVYAAGNGWTETGITWNNAPPPTGAQLGAFGSVTTNAWGTVNLPAGTIPGEGSYTLAVVGQSTNSAYYSSREGVNSPELDLSLSDAGPPSNPPIASFNASTTSGQAPLNVAFTDTSTGSPNAWTWTFGDLTGSSAQSPSHTFAAAGTYVVTLVASNASGASAPVSRTITVSSAPPPPPPPPPPGGNPIKTMTFENASLTDPVTGADSITGALVREIASPILGAGSVRVPNLSSGYLQETFTAAADAYVAFDLRLAARPTGTVRIVFLSDQGTTVGNIQLLLTGSLRLRSGSTTVGSDSTPLVAGTVYRVGLHQRRGTGSNGLLEAFLAPSGTAFGSPFASLATGTWTTSADRLRLGATAGSAVDLTADDIALDGGAMPGPSTATATATAGPSVLSVTATGYQVQVGGFFDCMIPMSNPTTVVAPPRLLDDRPSARIAGGRAT